MDKKLIAIIDKYRDCPEFFTLDITDVNQRGNSGDSLLHVASGRQAVDDMELLVAFGAQVNSEGDLGNTPLHQAASRGLVKSVAKLLELGANTKIQNEDGQTALDLAELMERKEVISLLKKESRFRRKH